MQAYTPSNDEELSGLCREIRRAGRENGLDPETEALLKMLEKPPFEDEADRIIRELNEAPAGDLPPAAENTARDTREKGRIPDGMMKMEARPPEQPKRAARRQKPARNAAAEEGRRRHPAFAVMLVTFSALLVAGAAFIVSSYRDGGAEEIPATPASLCEADVEKEGYILGIDGETLAVYYNGALQQSLDFPVAQLTDYDRELLQNGIRLEDEAAVKRAIEDYTS